MNLLYEHTKAHLTTGIEYDTPKPHAAAGVVTIWMHARYRGDIIAAEYIAIAGWDILDLRLWERPFGLTRRVRWAHKRLRRKAERLVIRIDRSLQAIRDLEKGVNKP